MRTGRYLALGIVVALTSACSPPWSQGPTIAELVDAANHELTQAGGLEISGRYDHLGHSLTIDLRLNVEANLEDATVTENAIRFEIVHAAGRTLYRGRDFLTSVLQTHAVTGVPGIDARAMTAAVKDGWFTSSHQVAPDLQDLENLQRLSRLFLVSQAYTSRTDNVRVDQTRTDRLSGHGVSLYVAEAPPHRLVRLLVGQGSPFFGINRADLMFSNYTPIAIEVPASFLNVDDAHTLPPFFVGRAIDLSGCFIGSCQVVVSLTNLGGGDGSAASTLTVRMFNRSDGTTIGSCTTPIPQTDSGATATASCSIDGYQYSATNTFGWKIDNPGYD